MWCKIADEQQSGFDHQLVISRLVLGEPLPIIVALQLTQEPKQVWLKMAVSRIGVSRVNSSIPRQRTSRLQLSPNQYGKLNRVVDRCLQLWAGLDFFTSESHSGNQASGDQEGTTLLFVVGHGNIIGEQKANIKSDGDSTGTNAAEPKKRRCTASASSPIGC